MSNGWKKIVSESDKKRQVESRIKQWLGRNVPLYCWKRDAELLRLEVLELNIQLASNSAEMEISKVELAGAYAKINEREAKFNDDLLDLRRQQKKFQQEKEDFEDVDSLRIDLVDAAERIIVEFDV